MGRRTTESAAAAALTEERRSLLGERERGREGEGREGIECGH
jgi:hypothetical protein